MTGKTIDLDHDRGMAEKATELRRPPSGRGGEREGAPHPPTRIGTPLAEGLGTELA